jgi:L-amino acid N-acyltransferase YncA
MKSMTGSWATMREQGGNNMAERLIIRKAVEKDLPGITEIYNQGIEDRIATMQEKPATLEEMSGWWENRSPQHAVLLIEQEGTIRGWAALNPYDHRCACNGVAELSVYVDREFRG